ncbi:unnamed protein product [Dovyalis caffra]|uniref:Uncharacterized protein n=1 Tax=Dovyalis caffra TaxID=77055 RepID=A0AAV1RTK5_9ROSI|nr:unnamed protein product [Dovyalis caffra]
MAMGSSSSVSRPNPAEADPQLQRQKRAKADDNIDPFVPRTDHNPRELRSWAKRTGFVSTFSAETTAASSNDTATPTPASDLDKAVNNNNNNRHTNGGLSPKIEIDPVLGRTRQPNRGLEIEPDSRPGNNDRSLGLRDESSKTRIAGNDVLGANPNPNKDDEVGLNATGNEPKKEEVNFYDHVGIEVYPGGEELNASGGWHRQSEMRYGLRDNPGFVPSRNIYLWSSLIPNLCPGGAYNYKGCSFDIPTSNILVDACRKHAYTMQRCRTDVSNAWRTAAWVRIPYPLQWGVPIFHFRTSLIMIIVSLVASVDSVGTYHSTSLLVNSRPPTPGIVSRGIALEGFCSLLAGLWGSGTGSTTLTENVHTVNITKVASRRAVEIGAVFLILFSFVGKHHELVKDKTS